LGFSFRSTLSLTSKTPDGETIIRITDDSVLVQALREIGIEAMSNKKVYDMVMAIRDAVVKES
jgi:hypothetical protein